LTGQFPAALTCRNITVGPATADLVETATDELGTARLSGPQPATQGCAISTWLIARAETLGVDEVAFAGQSWTAESGAWAADPSAGQNLSLHQVPATPPSSG
jgi:hypothetical protein